MTVPSTSVPDEQDTQLHVDASLGVAGDMLLAALVDAGADLDAINRDLATVAPGLVVRTEPTSRNGLRALALHVEAPGGTFPAAWPDVLALLAAASLDPHVRQRSIAVLERLAEAEARVHGVDVADVHFHELAAWDTVADVVGVVSALEGLRPSRVSATPVGVGSGVARGQHGVLPVPAPAVTELLARAGVPYTAGPATFEACTPTGAALLATLVDQWGDHSPRVLDAVGTGAGGRDPHSHPNVTRVLLGRAWQPAPSTDAVLVQTNVDDMDPRLWPGVIEGLLGAGAWDAWLTPIHMKKGRPAVMLSFLCERAEHRRVGALVLESTTAIGMRVVAVERLTAERSSTDVAFGDTSFRAKVARWDGRVVNVQPEWDDVAAIAERTGRPAKDVLAAARAAAERLRTEP